MNFSFVYCDIRINFKIFNYTMIVFVCPIIFLTWSLRLRKQHRLRIIDNRILSGIFGS